MVAGDKYIRHGCGLVLGEKRCERRRKTKTDREIWVRKEKTAEIQYHQMRPTWRGATLENGGVGSLIRGGVRNSR